MQKRSVKWSWFFLIVIQALVATCVGLFALSGQKVEIYPSGTAVQTVDIGRLNYDAAKAKLTDYYGFLINQGKLTISVDGDVFAVPYKDLDVRFDVEGTLKGISDKLSGNAMNQLITGESSAQSYIPSVSFNSGKLTAALENIFKDYEKDPVPDRYAVQDGKLLYTPMISGVRIDYDAIQRKISSSILGLSTDPVKVDTGDAEVFKAFSGEQTDKKFSFNTIISHSSIPLGAANEDEASAMVKSLSGNIFSDGASIKLSGMADISGNSSEGRQDMVDRVATAVYQAFLPVQGINVVNRRQSKIALPYAQAGLEAVIEGENADLELKNNTGHPLILLGEIRNGSFELYVVSDAKIPSGVLFAQKKDLVPPPVIYNVNSELKKGETKVISEGSDGFTVDVERVIGNERESLNTDRYAPVSKVVEVSGEPLNTGSK